MFVVNEMLSDGGLTGGLPDGLHVLTSLAQMQACRDVWRDLERRSSADLVWFQSFGWCYNWMLRHGGKHTPYVLVLVQDTQAVAILPLMKSRNRLGVVMLRMMGEPHTQYGNMLTQTGVLPLKQAQMFEEALTRRTDFDGVVCNYVVAGSPLEQVMIGKGRRLQRLDNQSMVIDLSQHNTPDDYAASLSKNTFKNLRRRRKHLEGMGALTFTALRPGDQNYSETTAACVEMKQVWLNKTARFSNSLRGSGHDQTLAAITGDGLTGDGPLVFALTVAGKPVALEIGFLQRGRYYSYMGAFDWELRQHAPGRLQMHETISWLIGQGVDSMDLLANPSDYKRDIASVKIPLASYCINRTFRAAAYATLWAGYGKPQLKRTLTVLTEYWRGGFQRTRKQELNAGV